MGSICQWTGTLSPSDFNTSSSALCKTWKEASTDLPEWVWMPCRMVGASSCNAMGYLAMENVYHRNTTEKVSCEGSTQEENEEVDDATLVQSCKDDVNVYDYHIVYNFNFKVPVLYFRGYQMDGCPLELDEIEKDLPAYSVKLLCESKWTFITKEDHPYLHRPWYTLHPCGTSDWMKLLLASDAASSKDQPQPQYLAAWLSVVGQTVGLRIPLQLYNNKS